MRRLSFGRLFLIIFGFTILYVFYLKINNIYSQKTFSSVRWAQQVCCLNIIKRTFLACSESVHCTLSQLGVGGNQMERTNSIYFEPVFIRTFYVLPQGYLIKLLDSQKLLYADLPAAFSLHKIITFLWSNLYVFELYLQKISAILLWCYAGLVKFIWLVLVSHANFCPVWFSITTKLVFFF